MNKFKKIIFVYLIISLINSPYSIYSVANNSGKNIVNNEIENWPFYQHDLQNTGFTSSSAPLNNSIRWTLGNMIDTSTSDIIAYNDVIYFPVGSPDNKFFAVDANSGKELWNISGTKRFGTVALYDNTIFTSYGEAIIAINISTHEIIWEFYQKSYESGFSNSRLLVDNTGVYFGAIYTTLVSSRAKIESAIYALERLTGKPIFKFTLDTNILSTTSLAIYQNKICFGTSSHEIYCIDKNGNNDGTILDYGTTNLIWKKFLTDDDPDNPDDIYSEPSISNEMLFVGGFKAFFTLDVNNGDEIWNYSTNNRITSSAAVDKNNIYFGNWDGIMYCLNKTSGKKVWSHETDERIDHHEASLSGNGKILFLNEKRLYCLYTDRGNEAWHFELNYPNYTSSVHTTPTIYNGTVFIRVINVYAIGPKIVQNTKPYFTKVEAEKSIVNFSEEIDIIIEAKDDEGDKIIFEYGCNGGKIKYLGSKCQWTAPDNFGTYNVYFNISDGKLSNSLVLQFEVVKPNEAPRITNISVNPNIIEPNNTTNISVIAIDNDSDELQYIYEIIYGNIIGTGTTVKWQAPNKDGIYEIEISVFDGELLSQIEIVNITVIKNYAPVIQDIFYFPKEIYINSKINISIMAVDKNNDLLNYHNKVKYGNMMGDGSNLTWYSPTIPGDYTLQFWVDDGKISSKIVILNLTVMEYNKPPIIKNIKIDSSIVKPGEIVKIEIIAIDPNKNDNISYFYKDDGNYIFNEDNIINWEAPSKTGQYEISIMVIDSFDAVVYDNITIIVNEKDVGKNDISLYIKIIIFLFIIIIIIMVIFIIMKKQKLNKINSKNKPIEVEPILLEKNKNYKK